MSRKLHIPQLNPAAQAALIRLVLAAVLMLALRAGPALAVDTGTTDEFRKTVTFLAGLGDRSTGAPGCQAASAFILNRFQELGFEETGTFRFPVPVLDHHGSTIFLPDRSLTLPIYPLIANAITPEAIPPPGLDGPLIYVGPGDIRDFNGKDIDGAVILMDMASGKNWLNAANFGAKALIYVDSASAPKSYFTEKLELSPVQFPRFWIAENQARKVFGDYSAAPGGLVASKVRLASAVEWREAVGENVYCVVPGTDPDLADRPILVEAFYDGAALVPGRAPAADEACSVATLLDLAHRLKRNPAPRPFILVATAGHGQSLAGLREMIWALRARSKELRTTKKLYEQRIDTSRRHLEALKDVTPQMARDEARFKQIQEAVSDRIKTEVDHVSRRLMALRLEEKTAANQALIKAWADRRLLLRRLDWQSRPADLSEQDLRLLTEIVPLAVQDHETALRDARHRLDLLQSALKLRDVLGEGEIELAVSLHLSSHGGGVGAFNRGWLFPLNPDVNRVGYYSELDELLRRSAADVEQTLNLPGMFQDTLRPSRLYTWESFFLDRPFLGGEVTALAGYLGVTLATVYDARPAWGTPHDTVDRVDMDYGLRQSALVCGVLQAVARAKTLPTDELPPNGLASVTGRAKFIRHGELFPDQPAPGTIILAYQGLSRFYALVDAFGTFEIHGVAEKKFVQDKVILEGYRFSPSTGEALWAIDKAQTGLNAYRVKIERKSMETDLVMFAGKQTTVFNLLEPRSFSPMTKIQLIDGRLEAQPLRYWYSRIDTRISTLTSVILETGVRLKMTLSDTVLAKKLILLNADAEKPTGNGYLVDAWPTISRTEFMVARDMWTLLGPRIDTLEAHGIYNEKIRDLRRQGTSALQNAEDALRQKQYDRFTEASLRSWALASQVYDHVERTQKDVLFGVLFYIALFVPFAFCLERFLFSFVDIHKRLIAFLVILLLLIALIYRVHPAFQLAYSPTVVILAFFIMGLSLIVTLIIFFRFEKEMTALQKRASQMMPTELSRWQAFLAAFLLGISNLRRRRLRTILTCVTLVILTFTIMSFTSVQTLRHRTRVLFQDQAPYKGFLLKNVDWRDLPPEALNILNNSFEGQGVVAPRVWLETKGKTQTTRAPVRRGDRVFEAQGVIGLSDREPVVTGIDQLLLGGRWFAPGDRQAVIISDRMAAHLGIAPQAPSGEVHLYGVPFKVVGVFSGRGLDERTDLDGEPLTPAVFIHDIAQDLTDVEMEALESGEDVQAFQGRYQHVAGDLTLMVPSEILLAAGGNLKCVAVSPKPDAPITDAAEDLVDRFKLTLFIGEPGGTYLYQASDALNYSGVPNIVIPILIAVFIVLNTMIGSVYERKREIGIYTSVGLAPYHVSFLFIAEAMALAVLSVVTGYLFAQASASLFSGTPLWSGLTVNYSSLAGVAAMILIFLVVLVSVIYPSRVAAAIAIPDVNRSWTMPQAQGAVIEIILPVLVKYREFRGLGGYIFTYFQNHRDISHGLFSTGDTHIEYLCPDASSMEEHDPSFVQAACGTQTCLHIRLNVWLAPFDFGIMQRVDVMFCPSESDPGFLEIKIRLTREAGEANAWARINKAFLNRLRKQILVWRSLPSDLQHEYETTFDRLTQPDTDPAATGTERA